MSLTEEGLAHIPGLMSRWVKLPSGAKAHYVTTGDAGPAVVLLHGGATGASGSAVWRSLAPFLGANGFRVYCPDMPGFGLADTRQEFWPVDGALSHMEFIHAFVDAVGLDRFHLSGNSMGCANTINYMLAHPARVSSFILINGALGNLVDAAKHVSSEISLPRFEGTEASMREHLKPLTYKKANPPDDVARMRTEAANRQKDSTAAFRAAGQRIGANPSLGQVTSTQNRLDKLTIPGLYLFGRQDDLSPLENGYNQEDVLPNVQFFFPDECGHVGQQDQPEMFQQVFLEFFTDGMVSRRTAEWAGVSKRRPELEQYVEQTAAAAG